MFSVLCFIITNNPGIKVRFISLFAQADTLADSGYLKEKISTYGARVQSDEHFGTITDSINFFKDSPIVGVGFNRMEEVNEHNYYIRSLATTGVITFITFILFLAGMILITRKAMLKNLKRNPSKENMGILFYAGLIAYIFYLNANPSEFYFYWIWFGLTAAWVNNSTYEERNENPVD